MVKVKLLVSRSGGQNRGDTIEVSSAEATRMVEAGQADLVRAGKKERAISRAKPERAAK